ncbi:hypothetical protein [Actinomadura mexicana]|uniref:Anti-sigma regulatory factor (Ser/Thr protein kinase) n=1 Tax=Actinomadura mexicana TaxID=134959 RepID=A0A238WYP3_9ACTN|nr:hypothetical protein [Actinomadura mexicana]SNR51334.1 hypothetical protein SAMN06265355_103444 [Actinomadura mexicana]
MNGLTGVIGSRPQQRPEFETGPVPYTIGKQTSEANEPTEAMVEHSVQGIFADLPPEVRGIVTRVAMELIRNAQWYGQAPAGVFLPDGPAVTLFLGWATDEREMVKYPLVMVGDRNPEMPTVQESTRTGLKRVISQTHRCGAVRTGGGKRAWAIVDPQPR